jgi:hypothetical protein
MSTMSLALVVSMLTAVDASPQSVKSPARFEVASIKRCPDTGSPQEGAPTRGRIDLACLTTRNLVRLAYLVFPTGQPNVPAARRSKRAW